MPSCRQDEQEIPSGQNHCNIIFLKYGKYTVKLYYVARGRRSFKYHLMRCPLIKRTVMSTKAVTNLDDKPRRRRSACVAHLWLRPVPGDGRQWHRHGALIVRVVSVSKTDDSDLLKASEVAAGRECLHALAGSQRLRTKALIAVLTQRDTQRLITYQLATPPPPSSSLLLIIARLSGSYNNAAESNHQPACWGDRIRPNRNRMLSFVTVVRVATMCLQLAHPLRFVICRS